jgi:hypothetical protein
MQEQTFELLRTTSKDEVYSTVQLLTAAAVPHKVSTSRAGSEITEIGRADAPRDLFITVREADFLHAREVLETAYAKTKLPPGHFLLSATDEDLIEVLGSPSEWSAIDVAHVRKMVKERGIEELVIQARREVQHAGLAHGRKAPKTLIIYGYVSALLSGLNAIGTLCVFGGVSAVLIGYSLLYSKERTPEGEFHRFDEKSRRSGKRILVIFVIVFCVTQVVLAAYLGARRPR